MSRTRPRALALVSGFALLFGSTALTPFASAQTAAPAGPTAPPSPADAASAAAQTAPVMAPSPTLNLNEASAPIVNRILVTGNERIEQGTVLSYLPIQPGQPATPERLDLALETLFRTGLFADVDLEVRPVLTKAQLDAASGAA